MRREEKERRKILAEQNVMLEVQVKERTAEINEQKKIIEEKNKDIDLLFKVGQVTFTKFERTLTKTICLRNLFIDVLEKNGYILSNNKNSNNSYAEKVKFKGA
jgi:hypothetical protein